MLFSEPKIPQLCVCAFPVSYHQFQCSSASRKFLNDWGYAWNGRAEQVSVLFSEPKIPQSRLEKFWQKSQNIVSVLFSEPKIPQLKVENRLLFAVSSFSALQRAENSSMRYAVPVVSALSVMFQCSSASRKFLN